MPEIAKINLLTYNEKISSRNEESKGKFRPLKSREIKILKKNRNFSHNWEKIFVADNFCPDLIHNSKFHGSVFIGKQEKLFLEYHDLKAPVGIFNSTIISCSIGDNVSIENAFYIENYNIGKETIIKNVDEMLCSEYPKFGNGFLFPNEDEEARIRVELGNENGNRSIIAHTKLNSIDAYLWYKYKANSSFQKKLEEITDKEFSERTSPYGKVGSHSVIKNTRSIKNVLIGKHSYIKGANKLKNLTIKSSKDAASQIGEGVELVNGIIGYGCRIFYGVKAVRFIMRDFSQLKYGARLINSFLGENSTISCCEVLNSLIFPFHEQHHNNSFLIAATVKGQSNMAAGATIGSNHNSRGADGEILAERGFWPALCSSFKHFSKFSSFCITAKGQYPYELNILLPFSLISNNESENCLQVMPAYWFLYNMYAMARNPSKFKNRDKRIKKDVNIEFDYLAPDSINEIFKALTLLEKWTAKAYSLESLKQGKTILRSNITIENEILADELENSERPKKIVKIKEGYNAYRQMVKLYSVTTILKFCEAERKEICVAIEENFSTELGSWVNAGGQLFLEKDINNLIEKVNSNQISTWKEIHNFYKECDKRYEKEKLKHAIASLVKLLEISNTDQLMKEFPSLLKEVKAINTDISEKTIESKIKDYNNDFRMITFDNEEERNAVLGKIDENSFIIEIKEKEKELNQMIDNFIHSL